MMNELVRLLFSELADLEPEERERIFAARAIAPEVRAEVESLLGFDRDRNRALTNSVASVATQALRSLDDARDSVCGPYRLIRVLGSGGMGSVYLAERADGEIQQKVAVKLLHGGADRASWRERFLRERQLLAYLNHPSIAHVLDAGHTGDGRPYLAMEYVDGIPIDQYAADRDLREQLALFLRVCEGVAHAHRHLIIHRDLKPSNILVDASGQPKILDFGIAKLLDATADVTQTVERMFAPNYASPEQLHGELQTTSTDIYSLGAVLHKLVTGSSPNESRQTEGSTNPALPTDLHYILRKALREEPEGRYASVEAFANDIRAFLESRPVAARTGDTMYRVRKFLRRNRVAVAAAALVIAGLSTGLYMADRERAIAQRRFSDVRQLSNKLFDIDAQVRELPGSTKTRQLIVDTALEYLRRLTSGVRLDPDLALEVGNAYMRVARVQGVPISPSLGQAEQAEQNLRIAQGFIESALKANPANRTALLRLAQISHDRMILSRFRGTRDEPLRLAEASARWLEQYHATAADRAEATAILTTYMNVADQFKSEQKFDEALRLCRRAADLARALPSPSYLGDFQWVSAEVYQQRGDLEEARTTIEEAVRLLDPGAAWMSKGGVTHNFQLALIYQGRILGDPAEVNLGESEEALKALNRAFESADTFVHRDPKDSAFRGTLAMAAMSIGRILRNSDAARALEIYDHTLRHLAEIKLDTHLQRFQVQLLAGSSDPLRRLGRTGEASARLQAAFEILKQLNFYPAEQIYPGSELQEALQSEADFQADGNLAGALKAYQDLIDRLQPARAGLPPGLSDAVGISAVYRSAAALYRRAGRDDAARALDARRRGLWQQWNRTLAGNAFVRRQLAASEAQ